MRRTLTNLTHNFARDEGGNTMIIFGLSIIPVVMFVGGAVDFGNAYRAKQKIQRAADSAVLAAVGMGANATAQARQTMATNVFNANVLGLTGVVGTPTVNGNTVSLTAVYDHPNAFLKIVPNLEKLTVGGSSAATVSYNTTTAMQEVTTYTTTTTTQNQTVMQDQQQQQDNTGKACILALDPGADVKGIAASGTPSINYTGCWSHTNSTNTVDAIHGNGTGTVVGDGHSAVGSVSAPDGMYSPAAVGSRAAIPDPFATNTGGAYATSGTYATTFTPPSYSTCKTGGNVYRQGTWNLTPGKWCEGLTVQANATVNFAAGEYVIENGALDFHSGAKVTGTDVLFYLKQTDLSKSKYDTYFQIVGSGNGGLVNLKGRTGATSASGLNGFLIIVHPDTASGLTSRIQGGTSFLAEGMIYAPKQNIKITGGGSTAAETNGDSDYFALVAKSFEFDGNGTFNLKKKGSTSTLVDRVPSITYTTTTIVQVPVITQVEVTTTTPVTTTQEVTVQQVNNTSVAQ